MKRLKSLDKAPFFIFGATLLIILSVGIKLSGLFENRTIVSPQTLAKTISTPTPKPALTSTPSPTPTPNYGYCLYVPVLFYHHIQPQANAITNKQTSLSVDSGIFDQQMAYLSQRGYMSISALDLVNALRNRSGLPPRSVVVSLDDGYADQYTNAFQSAKKYGIKLNLLIASGLLNNPGYMDWGQVNEIKNSGGYIIDHTWSHYSINYASLDKIKYEVETGRSQIEQYTGQKVDLFGYPYGGFNNTDINVLTQDNFLGAFTTLPGFYQCDSFIMALHRTRVGNASLRAYGL